MRTCSSIAPVSPRHLIFLLLCWWTVAMMTCSPVAPASPRRLLCLQLRWRTIAMSTCSVAAPKSNFLLLRLENTRLHIESRKQELVRLRTTLFLICSIPPEAHSLERRLSTRRTISAIPIRLYSRRILCTSTSKRSNLRIFVDYPPRHPISISIMAAPCFCTTSWTWSMPMKTLLEISSRRQKLSLMVCTVAPLSMQLCRISIII